MATHQHKIQLDAQVRTILGGKVRQVRQAGFVPAVLYGKGQEPISLQVPQKNFNKTLKEAGESTLVYVNVDGQSYPTIIHDVARDPASDSVIHADFYKVNLSEKIKTNVPVVFVGEAPATKEGGILVRNINELEVEALPQNLPHELTIDISVLKAFGDKITIGDLKKGLGGSVELTNEDNEAAIVAIQEPMSEEELKKMMEGDQKTVDDVEVIEKEKAEEVTEEGEPTSPPASAPEPKEEK